MNVTILNKLGVSEVIEIPQYDQIPIHILHNGDGYNLISESGLVYKYTEPEVIYEWNEDKNKLIKVK